MLKFVCRRQSPWHKGEKMMQSRFGVAEHMEYVGRKVIHGYMSNQHKLFYSQLPFVVLGTVDDGGQPWATLLEGEPGFARALNSLELHLDCRAFPHDPASKGLATGSAVGLLGIELHTRRRNRLNGHIAHQGYQGITITVDQVFGNCPKYIQLRHLYLVAKNQNEHQTVERQISLDDSARLLIESSDTFFVASYIEHEDGELAVDVSHRGGRAGFVRVEGNRLTIPDFPGNRYFNTLGNLLVNPRAGLLFMDFKTGDTLQVSGRTVLNFEAEAIHRFKGSELLWHVDVEQVVRRKGLSRLRWDLQSFSPNSLETGTWIRNGDKTK